MQAPMATETNAEIATETPAEASEQAMQAGQVQMEAPLTDPQLTDPPPAEPQFPERPANGPDPAFCRRLHSIREYGLAAGQNLDPHAAVLRGVTSDLLEAELYVGDAVLKELRGGPNSTESAEACRLPMDGWLRLTKQIAQYARLEQAISKSEPRDARHAPR